MVTNDWLLQFLADVMQAGVVCTQVPETTAYGISCVAGIGSGVFGGLDALSDGAENNYIKMPGMAVDHVISLREGWNNAVKSTCYYSKG
jgi:glycerol kinase